MDAEPIHGGRADTGERAVGLYLVVDTPQPDVADPPHRPPMLAVYTRPTRFAVVTNHVVSDE